MNLLESYERFRPRNYRTSWHHKLICEVVQRALEERKNAIVCCPPRHGKSEIIDVHCPAWWLGSHPEERFGLITNSDSLARKFSVACQGVILDPTYQAAVAKYKLAIARDSQWKIESRSQELDFSYKAQGIRGQLTGHGFSTLVFDDLLKSGSEAKSDVIRERVWDDIISTAINRLTPDGVILGMQARLHMADPIGKLLESELEFIHLQLPATNDTGTEAFIDDQYSGEKLMLPPYEALWPERFSRKKLDQIRSVIHSYYWSAQYAQIPSMGEMAYFLLTDQTPRWTDPGVQFWWVGVDCANTDTIAGAETAFVALGICGPKLKVLGARSGKWKVDDMAPQLQNFCNDIYRMCGRPLERVLIERAAGGYGLLERLAGVLPVEPVTPLGSKEDRAGDIAYLVNTGRVEFPTEPTRDVVKLEQQLRDFPLCSLKDLVDSFTHACKFTQGAAELKPRDVQVVEYDELEQQLLEGGGHDGPSAAFRRGPLEEDEW
jgi:hypothetical protein